MRYDSFAIFREYVLGIREFHHLAFILLSISMFFYVMDTSRIPTHYMHEHDILMIHLPLALFTISVDIQYEGCGGGACMRASGTREFYHPAFISLFISIFLI